MRSSHTFCLLRPLSNPALEALDIVENKAYAIYLPAPKPSNQRSREATPVVEEDNRAFAFTLRTLDLKDPSLGHVFGSDSSRCDILMDRTKGRGVSETHFRVQLDYTRSLPDTLFIRNLSRNSTRVGNRTLTGPAFHTMKSNDTPLVVLAGHVSMEISLNTPMGNRKLLEGWETFRRFARDATPDLANIQLKQIADVTPDVGNIAPKPRGGIHCDSGNTYKPLHQIGKGAAGHVYACMRYSDRVRVAGKVVQMSTKANENDVFHELNTLKRFSHPNLIGYQDFGVAHNHLWIMLDLATCGDLKGHLPMDEESEWSEEDTKALSWQVLSGLRYLHQRHTVHRDVKPANILIFSRSPAVYKLTDFGTTKEILDPFLLTLTFVGTAQYMAPEIWPTRTSEGLYDLLADIWSLGTIVWELLTTYHPITFPHWESHDQDRQEQRIYAGEEIRSWVPKEHDLEGKVSQSGQTFRLDMLSIDPAARPSAEECLEYDWFHENSG